MLKTKTILFITFFIPAFLTVMSVSAQGLIKIDVTDAKFRGIPLELPEFKSIELAENGIKQTIKIHEHEGVEFMVEVAYDYSREKIELTRRHFLTDISGRKYRGQKLSSEVAKTTQPDSIFGRNHVFVVVDVDTEEKYELWYQYTFLEQ